MQVNSTQVLKLIAKYNGFILLEKAVPAGRLKHELITVVTPGGKPQGFNDGVYNTDQFQLPRSMFNDFLTASYIEQDRPEDTEGRTFYRLTKVGKA